MSFENKKGPADRSEGLRPMPCEHLRLEQILMALVDAMTHQQVANAPHLPVHLGAMSEAVKFQVRLPVQHTRLHLPQSSSL